MRWFWIDRFTEFHSGRSATAVKAVSLSEDHLHDHFPGASIMPNSLILEGMAQTGGLLACEYDGFTKQVVLAKVGKVVFHFEAWPGDLLTYHADLLDINENGATVRVTSHINGKLQAEAEILFAHLGEQTDKVELFEPYDLYSWLRLLKLYEIGRDAQGNPMQVHPRMAESDRREQLAAAS